MFDGSTIAGRFCKAIAFAEGCIHKDETYNKFSIPFKQNNPGDLKSTASAYEHHMMSNGKLMFVDIGTGWSALAHQVDLMFTNRSAIYNNKMTIQDVANHYARENNSPQEQIAANNWANNVAFFLDVEVTTTLESLLHPVVVATPVVQAHIPIQTNTVTAGTTGS
jgi:hypothetical protein